MRYLVVAPHPDDETLGCGGSILRWLETGDDVAILIVTRTFPPRWSPEQIAAKQAEVARVTQAYWPATVTWLEFPSSRLDTVPLGDLIDAVGAVVTRLAPQAMFVPSPYDVHSDHRRVWDAATAVAKPFRLHRLGLRRVAAYEAASSTDAMPALAGGFRPHIFNDITPYMERKLTILSLYQTEVHDGDLPRTPDAVRAQARLHGSTVGLRYAERFSMVWEVL